jgi:hypothetical protein
MFKVKLKNSVHMEKDDVDSKDVLEYAKDEAED